MVLLILLLLFSGLLKEGKGKIEEDFPFRNVTLDWLVRVDDLVSRLSAHEIIDQMVYGGGWDEHVTSPIPRLGILSYR